MSHYILHQFKDFKNLIKHQFTFLEKDLNIYIVWKPTNFQSYKAGKIR